MKIEPANDAAYDDAIVFGHGVFKANIKAIKWNLGIIVCQLDLKGSNCYFGLAGRNFILLDYLELGIKDVLFDCVPNRGVIKEFSPMCLEQVLQLFCINGSSQHKGTHRDKRTKSYRNRVRE